MMVAMWQLSGGTLGDERDKFSFDVSMWMLNDELRRFQEEAPGTRLGGCYAGI